jgi:hypothetical protein
LSSIREKLDEEDGRGQCGMHNHNSSELFA